MTLSRQCRRRKDRKGELGGGYEEIEEMRRGFEKLGERLTERVKEQDRMGSGAGGEERK